MRRGGIGEETRAGLVLLRTLLLSFFLSYYSGGYEDVAMLRLILLLRRWIQQRFRSDTCCNLPKTSETEIPVYASSPNNT